MVDDQPLPAGATSGLGQGSPLGQPWTPSWVSNWARLTLTLRVGDWVLRSARPGIPSLFPSIRNPTSLGGPSVPLHLRETLGRTVGSGNDLVLKFINLAVLG